MSEKFRDSPCSVKISPKFRYLGILIVAFWTVCAYLSWQAGSAAWVPLLFLGFALLSVYVSLISGEISMDTESIRYEMFFSTYKMDWAEVKRIETDPFGNGIVFIGDDKYLAILSENSWAVKGRTGCTGFLAARIKELNLETRITLRAIFRRTGKNTKVSGFLP